MSLLTLLLIIRGILLGLPILVGDLQPGVVGGRDITPSCRTGIHLRIDVAADCHDDPLRWPLRRHGSALHQVAQASQAMRNHVLNWSPGKLGKGLLMNDGSGAYLG
jgi:hypothetical protein